MQPEFVIISAAITIVSFLLFVISLHSHRISGNKKLLFVSGVFIFFFLRGLFLSISLFFEEFSWFSSSYYTWVIDLVILTLLYVAALKR